MAGEKPSAVYRNRLQRYPDDVWLIWSNKWSCWYRDNEVGYTDDVALAGLYDRQTAAGHYTDPKLPKAYRDTEPFPLSSVRKMLERRRVQVAQSAAASLARIDAALAGRLSTPNTAGEGA